MKELNDLIVHFDELSDHEKQVATIDLNRVGVLLKRLLELEKSNTYYNVNDKVLLEVDSLVICKCPEWNDSGYQIANWDGNKFWYDDQPNDMFDECVIAFMPIDRSGLPEKL